MIDVIVRRNVTRPHYQTIEQRVQLHGYDHLTPKAARGAIAAAFGGGTGEVWWIETDPNTGECTHAYGYRVYAKSTRKIYPWLY